MEAIKFLYHRGLVAIGLLAGLLVGCGLGPPRVIVGTIEEPVPIGTDA